MNATFAPARCPIGFGFPFLLDRVIEQRRTGVVPDAQLVDVRFADLMQDHLS